MDRPASFKTFIQTTAQSVGIEHLDGALAASLGPDIEYRLREIIQEAVKFMKHSKRSTLHPRDITHALQLRNVETLYGYAANAGPRKYIRSAQLNNIYFAADDVVDFNQMLQEAEKAVPLDVTFSVHWLAIEGVQPAIPLNPSLRKKEKAAQLKKKKASSTAVKPVVSHVLSIELQRYFEEVTGAVLGSDEHACTMALQSIEADPGLNDLLPYFSQFIAEKVTHHLSDLPTLVKLMRFLEALLTSEHFHLEPYLHQLMPCMLTCLVGKQLCADPAKDDHWALRDLAAHLVGMVCTRFGTAYPTLQPRITKTLLQAFLDATKPLTTHYGAVCGLAQLGQAVVQTLLLPNLPDYVPSLKAAAASKGEGAALRRAEATKVMTALLRVCAEFVRNAEEAQKLLVGAGSASGGGATDGSKSKRVKTEPGVQVPETQVDYDSVRRSLLPDVPRWVAMLHELFGAEFSKLVDGVDMSVFEVK